MGEGQSRWDAGKHLVNVICSMISNISMLNDARTKANAIIAILGGAVNLHDNIAASGISLRDNTNSYQANWLAAMNYLLVNRSNDYDYLSMLL